MDQTLLNINNLYATLESGKEIICGLDLKVGQGEIHVIMGPNGAGKSTLANVIMGHPDYFVKDGNIYWQGEDITDLASNERAKKGIFLSFQTPEEIDGITMRDFLKSAKAATCGKPVPMLAFRKELEETLNLLQMDKAYADRYVNFGFSGGEKKKSEILQLLMLDAKLAILDETDSGLDVDAVKTVKEGIIHYRNQDETHSLLIISHSTKLLKDLPVDYVHVLVNGKIVFTGGKELIQKIDREGFADFLSM
ncbi:MAG: Fe-S cluster assembly ATPase SufC [Clostridiales bacterium]|nr:Fe-S cluster assembly ATPase SufC [Clostridiales bacterium]